jgi:hypothetical protein
VYLLKKLFEIYLDRFFLIISLSGIHKREIAGHWWLIPIMLATQEAVIRKSMV